MHLDEITIARYIEGGLGGDETQRLEGHLADCPACIEAVGSAYRMVEMVAKGDKKLMLDSKALQRAERLVVAPTRPVLWRTPMRLALAAAVVVVVGLVAYLQGAQPSLDRFRTTTSTGTFRGTLPEDGATVETMQSTFAWIALAGSVQYQFTLYTDEGDILWEYETKEVQTTLPASVALEAGAAYLWSVEGLLSDGTTRRTELHAFEVAP